MLGNKCFFQVVAVRARPWRNSLTDLAVVNAARPCTAYNLQIAEAKQQAGSWHVRSHPEGGFAEAAGKGYMIYHHFTVRVRLLFWVESIAEGLAGNTLDSGCSTASAARINSFPYKYYAWRADRRSMAR